MRSYPVMILVLALFSCSSVGCARLENRSGTLMEPPSIVLIIADDLGWGEVGYNGSQIKTPHIDTLAAQGMVLNRFYVYPTCSQTRAALLTGRRAGTMGLFEPITPWSAAGLPADTTTLAEILQQQEYATWLLGKWHLGHHTTDKFPHRRGFDFAYGNLGGEVDYYTHSMVGQLDWQRNGEIVEEQGHTTDLITHEAIRLLQVHPDSEPYFLTLSYNAPHTPLQPKESYLTGYEGIEDENKRRIAGLVSHLDEAIGRVIHAVRRRNDADNTLVFFFSDNGAPVPFGGDNGELRGSKMSVYEGGVRVPAVVWWPAQLKPGKLNEAISVFDIYPTLARLAGANLPKDGHVGPGVNVWPTIADAAEIFREVPIAFEVMLQNRLYYSFYSEGWKLVASNTNLPREFTKEQIADLQYELFNLPSDPFERENVADTEPEQLKQMISKFRALDYGEPVRLEPPPKDWSGPLMPTPMGDQMPIDRPDVVEVARINESVKKRSNDDSRDE